MQNEKWRACGLLLFFSSSYVTLFKVATYVKWPRARETYYAIWHERLIVMMGHPTLTIVVIAWNYVGEDKAPLK